MDLQSILIKMGELQETIEAGKAAQNRLDECRNALDNSGIINHQSLYMTRHSFVPGVTPVRETFYRFTRDFDLVRDHGNRGNRTVVDAASVEIDAGDLQGCRALLES